MKEITTIKLEKQTKERLDKLKENQRESYNQVIKKILYLLNLFRNNPEQGNNLLKSIDTAIKRQKVYSGIPQIKRKQLIKQPTRQTHKTENKNIKKPRFKSNLD